MAYVSGEQIIALYSANAQATETWFWEGLRSPGTPAMNPVIVIGTEDPSQFNGRHTAFLTWPMHQSYLSLTAGFAAAFLRKCVDLQSIDDADVATQICATGRAGRESRLIFRLHSWKGGSRSLAAEDLKALQEFFEQKANAAGLELCDQARKRLAGHNWSARDGASFGMRFCTLLNDSARIEGNYDQ